MVCVGCQTNVQRWFAVVFFGCYRCASATLGWFLTSHYLQSHFLSANALRVGLPFGFLIGPGMPPIRAQKDLRRFADAGDLAACFADTGGFKFMPCALAEARPLAFNPPVGFLPSLRCQAAVLATMFWTFH